MKTFHLGGDFASGADISWTPQMEASGFVFRNKEGKEQDLLVTLKEYGLNAIRLRTWVNPSDDSHRGHCSAQETLDFALRCQRQGFRIMIDFHYGDTWCDPGHQVKPKAWENLSFDDLVKAMYDYTYETMKLFVDGGMTPAWVQIGNETNPGMLLPDGSTDDFGKLARLYTAGHEAIKAASPQSKTMIHLAEINNTDFIVNYFDQLAKHGCKYDMIGFSYYPYWLKSTWEATIGSFEQTLKVVPDRFDKDVMLVEIGGVDEEEDRSYDTLVAALEVISRYPRCKGFFYWEPAGAASWSRYVLSAWKADGTPTRAMDAYLTIKP